MSKKERIEKIHELAVQFTISNDEQELKQVKVECIELLEGLNFESPTMGELRTKLVTVFANNLEKQIPKMVSGEING